jgi:predicted HTH domain antitoxin
MPRQLHLTLELPDDVVEQLPDKEIAAKAKEALVMELLREHHISQGKAAELLRIDRHELFDLMSKYRIPVIASHPKNWKPNSNSRFPAPDDDLSR